MTAQPKWEPTDTDTADLLTLLADDGSLPTNFEWDRFVVALRNAALADGGLVMPNRLRPLVRGVVKPNRIGAFTHRAARAGLIEATGEWQVSDDKVGGNAGRPMRCYRWVGGGDR